MHVNMEGIIMREKFILKVEDTLVKFSFENVRYIRSTPKAYFFAGTHIETEERVLIRVEKDSMDAYYKYVGELPYMYQYEGTVFIKETA